MLCLEIERELYKKAFGTMPSASAEDSLANFQNLHVDLSAKPPSFQYHGILPTSAKLVFAGTVSLARTKPSFKIAVVHTEDLCVPIFLNGSAYKSLASEGCFVMPWLVPVAPTGKEATLQVSLDICQVEIPDQLKNLCPADDRATMPSHISILVPSLVPTPAYLGKADVTLTRPEIVDVKVRGLNVTQVLGASHAINEVAKGGPAKPAPDRELGTSEPLRRKFEVGDVHLLK
jgi:hypothetical protein